MYDKIVVRMCGGLAGVTCKGGGSRVVKIK